MRRIAGQIVCVRLPAPSGEGQLGNLQVTNQYPNTAGMSAKGGSPCITSATNQLLMQTLLVLQSQNGHNQQAQSRPPTLPGAGTTVGGLGAPAQQQLVPDPHAMQMQR